MSTTSIILFDFNPLDEQITQIIQKTSKECDKFYDILKDLAVNKKNEIAINIRNEINDKIPTSLCSRTKFAIRKLRSMTMNTEEEYKEIIDMITDLPQIARGYIRRFNDEIALEGSGIKKIFIKTEEELAKPPRRSTLDMPLCFEPDGFREYQKFSERTPGKNLKSCKFSKEQLDNIIKHADEIKKHSIIEDAPEYATYDMISSSVYSIVKRQEQLRRALNKDNYSFEEIEKMSEEFCYNEILISKLY
jgi:predicted transcriptional regulator